MWVIEGGARDDALAVMLKVHHAVVDGVAGANLLAQLCGLEPDAPPPQPVRGAGSGNPLQIAASGLKGFAFRPLRLATVVPATMLTLMQTLLRAREGRTMAAPFSAPPTPFNAPFSRHRNIAYTQLDMRDVKRVKNRFGVTINDVVVALCAGVLRRFLLERGELPRHPTGGHRAGVGARQVRPSRTQPDHIDVLPGGEPNQRPRRTYSHHRRGKHRRKRPHRGHRTRPCCTTGPSSAARRCSAQLCGSCRAFR